MSKKIDRAMRGPSWAEVIIGAVLSIVLGVALAAVLLVLRPVVTPKTVAKQGAKDAKAAKAAAEPDKGAVVYIEGSRDTAKAKQADAKRKAFAQGQSVTVTEDELNVLAAPAPAAAAAAPKPAEKGKAAPKTTEPEKAAAPAAGSDETFATGAPNFRIDKGVLQIGVPVTVNAFGLGEKIIVQARGGFVKNGDQFVYEPDVLYFGSCPVQRLPLVCKYVRDHFLAGQPIPDDIKAAWPKLANVAIEGNALKLTMP